jgi:excisionase family DNA binding protein
MAQSTTTEPPAALNGRAEAEPPEGQAGVLPLLLALPEVAGLLRLSERTVKRMTAEGMIPGVCRPYGRSVRYSRKAVEEWIARGCPPVRGSRRRHTQP